jgi:hypothetical protein
MGVFRAKTAILAVSALIALHISMVKKINVDRH